MRGMAGQSGATSHSRAGQILLLSSSSSSYLPARHGYGTVQYGKVGVFFYYNMKKAPYRSNISSIWCKWSLYKIIASCVLQCVYIDIFSLNLYYECLRVYLLTSCLLSGRLLLKDWILL